MLLTFVYITFLAKRDFPWSHSPKFLLPLSVRISRTPEMQKRRGGKGTSSVRLLKFCCKPAGSLEFGKGGANKAVVQGALYVGP